MADKARQTTPSPPSASPMVVQFNHHWTYRLAWALVVAAHVGIVFAYDHEAYINSYILLGSKTEMAVQLLGLGATIRREIGVTLVTTNRILMAWHVFATAQILLSSFWFRRLVFRFPSLLPHGHASKVAKPRSRLSVFAHIRWALYRALRFYWSTGARGKHFNTAFEVREVIEIVSQTVQAYSISCLITNNSVLHFVSIVLVLNCWSTPLIRLIFKSQEAKKRLLCLAIDAIFDFCCALAIPFLTFSLWEYQVATLDFFDAVWLIRSSTLLQYNLVNTWSGVVTTRLPALGLILALETLKTLLHRPENKPGGNRAAPAPAEPTSSRHSVREGATVAAKSGPTATAVPSKRSSRKGKIVDVALFVYGLVILVLHTKAMAEPSIDRDASSNCLLQLRPWGRRKAQCAVVDIDCARLEISGSADEVSHVMGTFDGGVIASATFANCPALEMPPTIQKLKRLLHLEVYNSTIASWDAKAALTKDAHPVLTGVFLVRVSNLQSGLPAGLLSTRFPPSLCVMVVAVGDLEQLASSDGDVEIIRTKWPSTMFVFSIEQTPLRAFPDVLLAKTATQTLSLAANNITSVPSEVFVSTVASTTLWLSANPITALPALPPSVASGAKVSRVTVQLDDTQIQEIPSWFATLYSSSKPLVSANGAPLCTNAAVTKPSFLACEPSAVSTYFPLSAYEAKRIARLDDV